MKPSISAAPYPRLIFTILCLTLIFAQCAAAAPVITTPLKTYGLGSLKCAIYTPDGKNIIAAGGLGTITLLDANTGAILRTFTGHNRQVNDLAVSPNGLRMLSGSIDGTARLWDMATGNLLKTYGTAQTSGNIGVYSVAISPDADKIITTGDQGIRLWLSPTKYTRLSTGFGKSEYVFSHDGKTIAGIVDKEVSLWDVATGVLLRTFSDHLAMGRSVAFSPDDKIVISGNNDRTAIAWNVSNGEIVGYYVCPSPVKSVAFSPDGTSVFTVDNSNVRIWDAAKATEIRRFPVPTDFVDFSTDGRKVLSCFISISQYKSAYRIEQWDTATGALINTLHNNTPAIYTAVFSPDGRQILTGSQDGMLRVWDTNTCNLIRGVKAHDGPISRIAFAPDGGQFVTVSHVGKLLFWNAENGDLITTYGNSQTGLSQIMDAQYSKDGKMLALGGNGLGLVFYELPSMKRTAQFTSFVYSLHFMPDNVQCIIGRSNLTAQIIDSRTGALIRTFAGHTDTVYGIDAFPDGKRILTASADGSARIWNVENGFPIRTFTPSGTGLYAAAIAPGGREILTGGAGLHLLDANSGDLIAQFAHNATVKSVVFSTDGRTALSAGYDGQAKLWSLPITNGVESRWRFYE